MMAPRLACIAAIALVCAGAAGAAHADQLPLPHSPAPPPHPPAPPPSPAPPSQAHARLPAGLVWQRFSGTREVQLHHLAAVVRVMPEARADIAFAFANPGPLSPPTTRASRARLIVDGGLARRLGDCRSNGDGLAVEISRRGWVERDDLPVVFLRVPEDVALSASGGLALQVGPSASARLALDACGEADVERIEGEADITVSGADLDLRIYEAGSAELRMAGAGDVVFGHVHDGLTVSVAGAGDVTAARVDGPIQIAVQGVGDVTIRDGRATTMSVALMGVGDVSFGGEAERLDAAVFGPGDVRVRAVEGEVSKRVFGPGEVIVGR